jgi:hypothetical protein
VVLCQFWQANANCFEYKQLIRIIDQQAPVATCPTVPQVISDTTLNNPALWHAPVWKDVVRNVADLSDAPVELCISATDACTGANLIFRYQLQLDLDGDGTQETVVQSNAIVPPPAGSVYYNNAGQTNPTGGTPCACLTTAMYRPTKNTSLASATAPRATAALPVSVGTAMPHRRRLSIRNCRMVATRSAGW